MTPELELALVTFAAVVAAQLGKAAFRMIQAFVRKTPTNIDDKVLEAVVKALKSTHVVRVVEKVPHDTVKDGKFFPKGSYENKNVSRDTRNNSDS